MRILFDTNIVLDVLLARQPHVIPATKLFVEVERRAVVGLLSGITITTVHYIARRTLREPDTRSEIAKLLHLFEVAAVTRPVVEDALRLRLGDFEDAVLHESARLAGADGIVTRNTADFVGASLPVYGPDELLAILGAAEP